MTPSLLVRSALLLVLLAGSASAQTARVSLPVGAPRGAAEADGVAATPVVRPAAVAVRSGGFTESFDDVEALADAGWAITNRSDPTGTTSWFQGNSRATDSFPAYAGDSTAYVAANYNSTTGGLIWNWLLTPEVTLENGAALSFWTRTTTGSPFPDRLQVRLSTSGASVDVGAGAGEEGDFDTVLLDLNATYQVGGYPEEWTQYTVTLAGLDTLATGRFAFLYAVANGGSAGTNSNYIGIDEVALSAGTVAGEAGPDASQVTLSAGAPNPVASRTTLSYALGAPMAVSVDVVDALGRTVATLASGTVAAGTHRVAWDARGAAPGVYVVRLTAGAVVRTRRVVVAR